MSFATPLALLGLLAVPIVIALHSLAVRWRRVEVSSLSFWNEVLRDERTSVRIRQVLRSLALVAEVLAVAALSLAIARPFLRTAAGPAGDAILVLDATASMKGREGARTRFDLARERALAEIAGLRRDGRMLVIRAGRAPRILAGYTPDREALARAVAAAGPGDEQGSIAEALELAFQLRSPAHGDRVTVITDNAFDSVGALDLSRPWLRWIAVGSSRDNAGITALAFRRAPGRGAGYEMFLSVQNFSSARKEFPLAVRAGRVEVLREQVALGPGEARSLSLPWTGPTTGTVTAEIDVSDSLEADNRAFAAFAPARAVRVRLVGEPNVYLEAALQALPGVTVLRGDGSPGPGDAADLVVYDGVPVTGEDSAAMAIDTIPSGLPLRSSGVREGLRIAAVDRRHPVMASVVLEGTSIARAQRLEPGPGFVPLAQAGGLPVILAWEQAGRKLLVLGFDIRRSDLPLRAGFPVMLASAMEWYFPSWLSVHAEQAEAGLPVLLAPRGPGPMTVTLPGGARRPIAADGEPVLFTETETAGFYRVEGSDGPGDFAVSLASGAESRIAPRFEPPAAGPAAAGKGAAGSADAGDGGGVLVPAWGIAALAAFLLVVLEWLAWLRDAGALRPGSRA